LTTNLQHFCRRRQGQPDKRASPGTIIIVIFIPAHLNPFTMDWIRRHWLVILFYLVFVVVVLFIQPAQERFYLDDEMKNAHKLVNRINLICDSILIVLLVIYLLFKKIPRMSRWRTGVNFALFCLAIFSTPAIETTILFGNRKFPKGEYRHKYIVDSLAGDTAHKDLFLSDLEAKKPFPFDRDKLLSAEKFDRLHFRDTVYVTFYHGLFGIDYPCNSCSN
jgi:hypothetical protein